MAVSSYRLTFRINASHENLAGPGVHSHTFEISVLLNTQPDNFRPFDQTEKQINAILSEYNGKSLNTCPPFDHLPPTLENVGDALFVRVGSLVEESGYRLIQLTISQSPEQTYKASTDTVTQEKFELILDAFKNIEELSDNITKSAEDSPVKKSLSGAFHGNSTDWNPPRIMRSKDRFYHSKPSYLYFICAGFIIIAGYFLMLYVKSTGLYPLGLDIHGHLFKSDLLHSELSRGKLFPLFTPYWYNGVQPFRYWAPLPYYSLAFLQFIGGTPFNSYLLFIWLSFSVGGLGWLLFARKLNRPYLGLFISAFWFFMPENLRVFFGEGNVPRMFVAMVLPYIVYSLWQFVYYEKKKAIFPLVLLTPLAVMGHLMIAAMLGIASAIFLAIYSIVNKRYYYSIIALFSMFLSFFLCGVWLFPALVGGLASMNSEATSEVMLLTSVTLSKSLNPMLRFYGNSTGLYFGLSILIISIVGLILSNKKSSPGFISFLIIVIASTTALAPLILLLPFSQLLWVSRFTPVVYAFFLLGFLEWKSLKRPLLISFCIILALDGAISFSLDRFDYRMNIPATIHDMDRTSEEYLFTSAKEKSLQRVSLMDLSLWGPMPSYTFGTLAPQTEYVFGWAWQGAVTAQNIAYLNESLEKGNYLYLFDRNLELGADVVLINKNQIKGEADRISLEEAATIVGYQLEEESDYTLLYRYPVEGRFGVITDYSCLAIGTTAALVPGILPYYHPGDKLIIDDYSLEELTRYEKIYLSGFFYDDRQKAEELVRAAADQGAEIFIDMSRIPADPLTNRMTFLDVDAQPISFTNNYPILITDHATVQPKPFIEDYSVWNTVYLNGLDDASGYAWFENSPRLDFIGTAGDSNITFIGFNILFHAYTADDLEVKEILNQVMDLKEGNLPVRTVVPIDVEYKDHTIEIYSEYDNVNTTLAYQDIFNSEQPIRMQNNFLFVDKGTTVITYSYPYLSAGILLTIFGLSGEALVLWFLFKKSKKLNSIQNDKVV
ncbi:MAG: hypothetical protein GXY06_08535 [Clostridiaceae bacterium]|nr:hypothetical protein [Clostridiaceae bacterium]